MSTTTARHVHDDTQPCNVMCPAHENTVKTAKAPRYVVFTREWQELTEMAAIYALREGRSLKVAFVEDGEHPGMALGVDVYGWDRNYVATARSCRINWPSIGTVGVDTAAHFRQLLDIAVTVARLADDVASL